MPVQVEVQFHLEAETLTETSPCAAACLLLLWRYLVCLNTGSDALCVSERVRLDNVKLTGVKKDCVSGCDFQSEILREREAVQGGLRQALTANKGTTRVFIAMSHAGFRWLYNHIINRNNS